MFCRSLTVSRCNGQTITAMPLICKCWQCELCREILQRKVIAKACAGQPDKFMTLTVNPRNHDNPTEAAHALKDAFQKLIRQLRREKPDADIQYLAVWERTKRGWPHLHVLMRSEYIPQKRIASFMEDAIGAPVVDIRGVGSVRQVARYVGKYLSKALEKFEGCQRHWNSRNWQEKPERGAESSAEAREWTVWNACVDVVASHLRRIGYVVTWDSVNPERRSFVAHPERGP